MHEGLDPSSPAESRPGTPGASGSTKHGNGRGNNASGEDGSKKDDGVTAVTASTETESEVMEEGDILDPFTESYISSSRLVESATRPADGDDSAASG